MPTAIRQKRVSVDFIKEVLGEKAFEKLIAAEHGTEGPRAIKIEKQTYVNLLAWLQGKGEEVGAVQMPPIFRLYFREVPFVQYRLVRWLKEKIEQIEAGESATLKMPTKRKRSKARSA